MEINLESVSYGRNRAGVRKLVVGSAGVCGIADCKCNPEDAQNPHSYFVYSRYRYRNLIKEQTAFFDRQFEHEFDACHKYLE